MARRKAESRVSRKVKEPRKVRDLSARKGPKGGGASGSGVPPLSGLLGGGVPGLRRPGDQ